MKPSYTTITRLIASALMIVLLCASQEVRRRKISGSISDADNNPIAGANLLIMGTPNGTVTKIDGTFELDIPTQDITLYVAYVRHKSLDIPVSENDPVKLKITLIPDTKKNKKLKSTFTFEN